MSKLTIVQILPALNHGGVERGTIEVANYLAKHGCRSIVISNGGQLVAELHNDVEHIQIDLGKKSLLTLLKVNKLKKILVQEKINIVHARSRLPAWIAFKAISKIKSNKPKFITTVHGLYSVKNYSSIMARGDEVIAVSKTAKLYVEKNYQKHLKKPVHLIYRGIDPETFPYQKLETRNRLNLLQTHPELAEKKLVLLPGRLSTLKGLKELKTWLFKTKAKLLLTSEKDANKESQDAYLWLKNKGLSHKVVWMGFQSHIAKLYASVDLVISASTRPESFGRTVAEALATGTPVVAYNHGGVSEILNEIYPQGLVKALDAKSLSDKIELLLSKPQPVENRQPFQLETMLSKTLKLYNTIK